MVDLPDGIAPERERRTVCIDECIVPQIKALWAAGIQTLGCCCGHDKRDPDVILPSDQNPDQTYRAHKILSEIDGKRRWEICEWRLVQIATVSAASNIWRETADNTAATPGGE